MRTKNNYKYNDRFRPGKGVCGQAPSTLSLKVSRPKRDWSKYNKQLVERGNTMGFVRTMVMKGPWVLHTGSRGRPQYSAEAITVCYMLMGVLNLTTRGVNGYLTGVFELLGLNPAHIPSPATICRNAHKVLFSAPKCTKMSTTRLVDGTGFGYKMRGVYATNKYGEPKRRRRFALTTLVTDAKTGVITGVKVTPDYGVGNGEVSQLPDLLGQETELVTVLMGDGAYDTFNVYSLCESKNITLVAPPQINAVPGLHPARDVRLTQIGRLGVKMWKQRIGYHTRSLIEATNGGVKSAFGDKIRATTFKGAKAHIIARILVYNMWLVDALT